MGLDCSGLKPTSKNGERFRRRYSQWSNLAILMSDLCPEPDRELSEKRFHIENGGLDAQHARALAEALDMCLQNGAVDEYLKNRTYMRVIEEHARAMEERAKEKNMLDDLTKQVIQLFADDRRPLTRGDVEEFVAFLKDCGGYRTW
jgi:hypothetical protein